MGVLFGTIIAINNLTGVVPHLLYYILSLTDVPYGLSFFISLCVTIGLLYELVYLDQKGLVC